MTAELEEIERAICAKLDQPVERIETHAAIILLGGDQAFKLKKRVAYSFLDFTTLDAREKALRNELKLNLRTAPGIYREVLPVTFDDGRLEPGGRGEVVDWVLVMNRFPQSARLDHVAEREGLQPGLMQTLGQEIACFHAGLTPLFDRGGANAHREIEEGNEVDLLRSVPLVFADVSVGDFNNRIKQVRKSIEVLLEQRRAAGFVRHCHGDIHLENIALVDEKPLLFDAIEFNDSFAEIDTIYDVAFLVMDLLERQQEEAAWWLLEAYSLATSDYSGLALLPFFLATRAAIRAKIEAFSGHGDKARAYLALAGSVLEPVPPRLVAVGGLSGTGKTTLARAVAPLFGARPGAVHLRSDVIRKQMMGVALDQRLGDDAYRNEVSERVFEEMFNIASGLLRDGRSVVLDAVFARPHQRERAARIATSCGAAFDGIWLETNAIQRSERVTNRTQDASDADARVVEIQESYDTGDIDWIRLSTESCQTACVARMREALHLS